MVAVITPAFKATSLIAQFESKSGHIKTQASLTFPIKVGEEASKSPILNLEAESDTTSRVVLTLDAGPTNPTKDLSVPPSPATLIPIFIDPGWATAFQFGDLGQQALWGGKVLVKQIIVRCEAGAVGLYMGYMDPYSETSTDPPAKTRPFILQEGGIFAQSFKSQKPYLINSVDSTLPESNIFAQGVASIGLDTYEDFNRIRVVAVAERYN